MTGIEFSRKPAIERALEDADDERGAERGEDAEQREPAPVRTATMPPSRYIDETERSNSPAIIVRPSASATSP